MWWRSVVISGMLIGMLVAILPHVLWLVSAIVGRVIHHRVAYAPFGLTALGLVLIVWILMAWGSHWGMWQIEVNDVEYKHRDVPAQFNGYRIVHISDLHVDTYNQHPEALQRVIDTINAQHPDLILFTGDMVTGGISSISQHEPALRSLHAPDGVMSVLGNHDFFIYDRTYHNLQQRLAAADSLTHLEQERLGWTVLRNAHTVIRRGTDSICIAGVDNINGGQGFPTIQMGNLNQALRGAPPVFTVLLSHDPSHWQAEVLPQTRAHITLSGHTHAAQMRLFGWSLAHLSFRECDGRYDEADRMLYVNAGIGSTAPFRIGCPSEITIITLRSESTY